MPHPAPPHARIKERPEDFIVEELRQYEPSGAGEHLFIQFTKTGRTTDDVVRAFASALGANHRDAGVAGMKDRHAVTTQTISIALPRGTPPADFEVRARGVSLDGVTVHEVRFHENKLKPGHLKGNRFTIRIRGIDEARLPDVLSAFERVGKDGVPNAFGEQRFGRDGRNMDRAREWLTGKVRPPGDPRLRRLLFSSMQSEVFNAVLAARVADGSWLTALPGDLLKLHSSGGLFECADVQVDSARVESGEVSPTGPIPGAKMRRAGGAVGELEERITREIVGGEIDLNAHRKLGEGSRRALRLWVEELSLITEPVTETTPGEGRGTRSVVARFVLTKGAYATTVIAEAVDTSRGELRTGGRDEDEATLDNENEGLAKEA